MQAGLVIRAMSPIVKRNTFEVQMTQKMQPHQGNILYSFDVDVALKGRSLVFDYQNLWEKEYPSFEIGALVLFHPTKFSTQWKDKNPMINWKYLQKKYALKIIQQGPQGWILYEIQAQ